MCGRSLSWCCWRVGVRCASRSAFACGVRRNAPHRDSIAPNWIWRSNWVPNAASCTPSQAWQCKRSRWPVEELFRDEKQLVKLAGGQSPQVEAQKAHIALVLLAWVVLQCLRQAPSQTTGEVQEALVRTV